METSKIKCQTHFVLSTSSHTLLSLTIAAMLLSITLATGLFYYRYVLLGYFIHLPTFISWAIECWSL